MTKEKIETRLKQLESDYEKAVKHYEMARANVDAFAGAIQDCRFWLNEFNNPAEAPLPDQKD